MGDIEIAARFALASQFALLAAVLLRDRLNSTAGLMAGIFALAGFADLVTTPFGPRVGALGAFFQAASISGVFWFWLLAKALFDDSFRWRSAHLGILAALLVASLTAYFYTEGFTRIETNDLLELDRYKAALLPQQLIVLILGGLVIFEALKDWRSDLVESRRRFRRIFLLSASTLLLVVSFSNFFSLGTAEGSVAGPIGDLAALVLVMFVISRLLQVRTEVFAEGSPGAFPTTLADGAADPIIGEINALMEKEAIYAEHGLTIVKLADRLNEREYRVRRAINGSMGYRNFNQFLNHFRIAEATRRLVAPETRRLPILTIAIDVGYASLAPFNKAFKATHGITPSQYRKQHGIT